MIPPSRVVGIDGLAIFTRVVHPAITVNLLWGHAHQWPALQALHSPALAGNWPVANVKLVVSTMIDIHADFDLYHTAGSVGSLWCLHKANIVTSHGPLVTIATHGATIPAMRAIPIF